MEHNTHIGAELDALADAHPHTYTTIYSDALEFDLVVDTAGHVQSAERCAQLMNDRDAIRILLARRAADVARLEAVLRQIRRWIEAEERPGEWTAEVYAAAGKALPY